MGLLDRVSSAALAKRPGREVDTRSSIDQYIAEYLFPSQLDQFGYGGQYPFGLSATLTGDRTREITATLPGYMAALRMCPPAFAAQDFRAAVLSQARFIFRNRPWSQTPGRTFGSRDLGILETPWPNATTGELVTRMEWHAGLAGNAYVTNRSVTRLRVLRPDWTCIVYGSEQEPEDAAHALDGVLLGYGYRNGGFASNRNKVHTLLPSEMAHWSPKPDPENVGIGMSWLTPAIREIQGDRAATDHKLKFFENGAPQPLDARILTPAGWTTMGAVRPGDRVIGSDGKARPVTAVYPQGLQPIYRVMFGDGATVECTADHLWTVSNNYDRRRRTSRTLPLADLIAGGFHYRSGPAKWAVPMPDPVEYESGAPLPLDPYLMGLLLGDGSFRSNGNGSGGVTLACAAADTDETMDRIRPTLPCGVTITRRDRGGWSELYFKGSAGITSRIAGRIVSHAPNPLTQIIRDLGLFDVIGRDKFIPAQYLRASAKDREALLQGLIDSDGHVCKTAVRFTTTSVRLADDLADLVGSLGGVATVRPNRNRSTLTITLRQLPEWVVPVRLLRKVGRYRPTGALRVRTIVSAELVREAAAQCIAVDSTDHLYITDGYVLTHNTPNMVVKGITAATREQFEYIVDSLEARHAGIRNAYRTLYLAAGADATVVGADLKQIDFKVTQGAGETRIASVGGIHPVLLGLSEGLQGSSLNAGNFGAARRITADRWIYPTLQDLAASLASLVKPPRSGRSGEQDDAELWYDTRNMPILREDARDAADIQQVKQVTIRGYVDAGFTPESAVAAVDADDRSLLVHTGLFSVQLQPPGTKAPASPSGGTP